MKKEESKVERKPAYIYKTGKSYDFSGKENNVTPAEINEQAGLLGTCVSVEII